MLDYFEKLGIDTKKHIGLIGKLKDFIEQMVKQQFIKKEKIEESEREVARTIYHLGPRK